MSNTPTITASPSYEEGVYKWYDSVSGTYTRSDSTVGTDASDSMDDTTILFEVPADYEASVNLSLTVDDWGTLTVTDEAGNEKLKLSLTSAEDAPGVRGGHAEWSDSGSVNLPAGKYQIKIHHENVTYTGEYADKSVFNVSKCNFSLSATKSPKPHTVQCKYKIKRQLNYTGYSASPEVILEATCSGGEITQRTFSGLKVVSFEPVEFIKVLTDGRVAKIVFKAVRASMVDTPVYDSVTNTLSQKVMLEWDAESWDPVLTGEADEVEHIDGTFNSLKLTPPYAYLICNK